MPRRAVPAYGIEHHTTEPVADSVQPLLEALRTELTKSAKTDQLEHEVAVLTQERVSLLERIEHLEAHVAGQQDHVVTALSELRSGIRERIRALDTELRLGQLRTSEHLESLLESLESGITPPNQPRYAIHSQPTRMTAEAISYEVPITPRTPGATYTIPETEATPKKEKAKRRWRLWKKKQPSQPSQSTVQEKPEPESKPVRLDTDKPKRKYKRLLLRTSALALTALLAWQAWLFITPTSTTGTVAGSTTIVSTPAPSVDPYAESYVELPFAATEWKTYNNPEYGVSISYPKNTSNLVQNPGGNNIWFLRRNGFLVKISRIETTDNLEVWWSNNQFTYRDSNQPMRRGVLNSYQAFVVPSVERTITSGTSYFVGENGAIYQVWVKDEPATTDDGQRIEEMVKSLKFISNSNT